MYSILSRLDDIERLLVDKIPEYRAVTELKFDDKVPGAWDTHNLKTQIVDLVRKFYFNNYAARLTPIMNLKIKRYFSSPRNVQKLANLLSDDEVLNTPIIDLIDKLRAQLSADNIGGEIKDFSPTTIAFFESKNQHPCGFLLQTGLTGSGSIYMDSIETFENLQRLGFECKQYKGLGKSINGSMEDNKKLYQEYKDLGFADDTKRQAYLESVKRKVIVRLDAQFPKEYSAIIKSKHGFDLDAEGYDYQQHYDNLTMEEYMGIQRTTPTGVIKFKVHEHDYGAVAFDDGSNSFSSFREWNGKLNP